MSRVLEVPYGQLGDMTKRQAMNLSVLRVDDGASLSTTYAQAKTRAPMLHTTSPSAPFVKSRMPHKFDDAPAPPLVRDVAFARWEVLPLSANLTLDEVLSQVVRVNEGATASYTPKQNLILKIKVRFSDASEITFVRQDVNRPDSLRYAGFYSALSPSGGDSATPPKSANPFANSASAAFTRKGPVNSRLPDITTGLSFPTKDERKALFRRFDPNGNGVLSLAELDKAVTELWPSFNIKPAIMRAYRAADLDGSGLLGANEFEAFLRYLINYHKVWTAFSKIDANRDRRVSLDEFVAAAKRLEPSRSEAELTAAFRKIDKNGAGYILFDEFCAAMVADRPNIMNHIPPQPLDRIATTSSASAAASKSASGKSFSKRLKQLEMPDAARRKQIFKQLDPNGNGLLSLAELDKGVVELWPDFNHKPALMRAYRAADVNRSGFVGKAEFEFFIRYLVHFNNLWAAFADADADGDRRISLQEFLAVRDRLQVGTESEARQAFAAMDANRGGYVLFEEFCDWMAKHKAQYELQFTQPKVSSVKKPKRPSQTFDMSATSVTALPKPSAEKIAEMWKRADFNGNGMVSLAELDKHVIELWPHFNNKPALMRAYKATDKNGNGTVSRKEFAQFFDFLVHYTNLWAAFESIDRDNDHRVTLKEFTKGAAHLRINATPEKLAQLFNSIDKNGGGFILFDEFCGALAQLKATASA